MVNSVTSLTGNGLKDWLIQRVTAVYFALYVFGVLGFVFRHSPLDYQQWTALFHQTGFQVASVIALLTLSLHAWIGIWTITTDYLKGTVLRVSVQLLVAWVLLAQFIWGFMIVWGQ